MRGGFFNSPIASVMLDSHEYLRQAEEKFRAGQISEKQYIGLRRDLQQMAESSEYELFKDYFPCRPVMVVYYSSKEHFIFFC